MSNSGQRYFLLLRRVRVERGDGDLVIAIHG